MIKNIVFSLLLICLLVAVSIKLVDSSITHVELGTPFFTLLNTTSIELASFKIEIPNIPRLDYFHELGEETITINNAWDAFRLSLAQFNILRNFFNSIISFINFITTIVNFTIMLLNVVIQTLQFTFILLKNLIVFRDTLVAQA